MTMQFSALLSDGPIPKDKIKFYHSAGSSLFQQAYTFDYLSAEIQRGNVAGIYLCL